jgi:hypothetical protein
LYFGGLTTGANMRQIKDDEFKQCKCCGIMYANLMSNDVCLYCNDSGQYDYFRVRDYVRDHQNCSIIEVSRAINVSVAQIIRFIKEGRIQTVQNSNKLYIPLDKLV